MTSIFTPEEQKIRRRWVLTLMCMVPYDIVVIGLASLTLPQPLRFFVFVILAQLVGTGLLYYFTYKKNGHKLLFTSLFITLTSLPQRFSQNNLFSNIDTQAERIATLVVLAIMFCVWAWWAFVSFKIVELHRSLKPSRKCKKAMAPLQIAQTLQELDHQFQILKDQFPRCERALQAAYQTKKGTLLATS